ncbi:hypothetical protein BDW74DRAFT_180093 [Aspergillus multicolor]|uniref:uncharacterized protein n=1 Tax=Aspergillus multicolor TaxID=41759 RepID=UPI003CCCB4D1
MDYSRETDFDPLASKGNHNLEAAPVTTAIPDPVPTSGEIVGHNEIIMKDTHSLSAPEWSSSLRLSEQERAQAEAYGQVVVPFPFSAGDSNDLPYLREARNDIRKFLYITWLRRTKILDEKAKRKQDQEGRERERERELDPFGAVWNGRVLR